MESKFATPVGLVKVVCHASKVSQSVDSTLEKSWPATF
jgi:hypothetical protein